LSQEHTNLFRLHLPEGRPYAYEHSLATWLWEEPFDHTAEEFSKNGREFSHRILICAPNIYEA
jgi:hypothetical protein